MKMKQEETWIGIGSKVGGMYLVAGKESTAGIFFNAANPLVRYKFDIRSYRLGLGLGGSGGLTIIFVFKLNGLKWLDGRPMNDWGVNIALADAIHRGNFHNTVKLVGKSLSALMGHIEEFRDFASFIYNAYGFEEKEDHPVVSFDVPGVGGGVELSGYKSFGKISVFE